MTRAMLVLALSSVACGSRVGGVLNTYRDAPFVTDEDVKHWSLSSAPGMFFQGVAPSTLADFGNLADGGDSSCPLRTVTALVTRVQGGCTDSSGRQWLGSMQSTEDGPDAGSGNIVYSQWGYSTQQTCNGSQVSTSFTYDGTMVMGSTGAFTIELYGESANVSTTCAPKTITTALSYSGTRSGSTWNGSGYNGSSEDGKVYAETKDEVTGGSCSYESASGTTTLKSGTHTAVITYDGATKCDPGSTVKWSLDGVDKGELTGVQCSSGGGLLAWAALTLLLKRRRKNAPSPHAGRGPG
jgi:hypothetical protein